MLSCWVSRISYLAIHSLRPLPSLCEKYLYIQGFKRSLGNVPRVSLALFFCVDELATASAPLSDAEFKQLDLDDARLNQQAKILM